MTADLPAPLQSKPHPMKSNIDAKRTGHWRRQPDLPVGAPHRMAWHVGGNPEGQAWLLLHGGPGSGAHPGLAAPLDLTRHWFVAPDQRGSGVSRPRGAAWRNHTAALVSDLERLREHLGLARWSVLAGSWGTVLALAYARAHPQRVERLVLRGAFALSRREVGGLLQGRRFGKTPRRPEGLWPAAEACPVPVLLARLHQLLQSVTPGVAALGVARHWALRESRAAARGLWRALLHAPQPAGAWRSAWANQQRRERRALAGFRRRGARADRSDRALCAKFRIQSHYLRHRGFVRPGQLDHAVMALAGHGVPVDWVHGRWDAVCPPRNSQRWAALGQRINPSVVSLTLTTAGHLGPEPDTLKALRARVGRP